MGTPIYAGKNQTLGKTQKLGTRRSRLRKNLQHLPRNTLPIQKNKSQNSKTASHCPQEHDSGKTSQNGAKPKYNSSTKSDSKPQHSFGKEKITVILKRDYNKNLSLSTVGRIITLLAAGIIQKSRAAPTAKQRQIRNGYTQRKPFKEYSNATLGEDVQIDQTTIKINGRTYKLFQVCDRCSKLLFSYLYCDAKSATAKRFLNQMIKTIPFKIKSTQVDGRSEFRGKFEQACASLNISLFVISPRQPKHNGRGECANRTIKEELYHQIGAPHKNITDIRRQLQKVVHKYNYFRPHNNLAGLTPMQYIQNFYLNNKKESQYG